jgi:hypothetical protein
MLYAMLRSAGQPRERSAIRAMYAGVALTVAATIVPHVDANGLAAHIRAGYPAYTPSRIDSAVTTYLVYLTVVGAFGVIAWLCALRSVKAGKRWARAVATTLLAVATSIALVDLLVRDTSGDTGLPPLLGWIGLLPCLAGLVAVTLLFKKGRRE